jgi:hypothetical protein
MAMPHAALSEENISANYASLGSLTQAASCRHSAKAADRLSLKVSRV